MKHWGSVISHFKCFEDKRQLSDRNCSSLGSCSVMVLPDGCSLISDDASWLLPHAAREQGICWFSSADCSVKQFPQQFPQPSATATWPGLTPAGVGPGELNLKKEGTWRTEKLSSVRKDFKNIYPFPLIQHFAVLNALLCALSHDTYLHQVKLVEIWRSEWQRENWSCWNLQESSRIRTRNCSPKFSEFLSAMSRREQYPTSGCSVLTAWGHF